MDELIALPPMAQRQLSIQHAVQDYGKRLFRFIRNRVKNDEDAEDILQDVWYQLSSIIETEPLVQLGSWLYRVSRNRITDKSRKRKTQSLEDLAYEDEEGDWVFPEALLLDDLTPDEELERAYLKEIFFEALSELPEKQRKVFVLNEMEQMTLKEIAEMSGESIKTITSRKQYAVAHLREKLQKFYNEY
jgi:RNA polymerase sigma factor (sigma-70 family)